VIGFLSIPMNLVVKNIKVDNFAFVAGINLEKKDKNEFINKLMDFCDDKFNKFSSKMNEEDELIEMNNAFDKNGLNEEQSAEQSVMPESTYDQQSFIAADR